jgi:uncharacterized protein (PEP-CTERM system associated)
LGFGLMSAFGGGAAAQTASSQTLPTAQMATGPQAAPSGARAWLVAPSASLTETLTDNALLRDSEKRADAVTQVTAGVSVLARTARVQGTLDYQLTGTAHARESKANQTSQALRSALHAEVVDNLFFLDASANISQRLVSALGRIDVDGTRDNANRAEVADISIRPSLRARFGNTGFAEGSVNFLRESNDAGQQGDVTSRVDTLSVGARPAPRLGWNVTASRQSSDFKDGRSTSNERATAGLTFMPDAAWVLGAHGGRERNDIVSNSNENSTTWGVSVQWRPDPYTTLVATRDRRYFGDAHLLSFQHRGARTSWQLSSSRDVQSTLPSLTNTTLTSVYDLLFDALAGEQPDPLLRRQLVLARLQALGIPVNAAVTTGFLRSAATLVDRHDASVAYSGRRLTAALLLNYSHSRRVDQAVAVDDDLSQGREVRQHGYALSLSHRLTPVAGVTITLAEQRTRSTDGRRNDLTTVALNWSTRLGRKSNVSLGARRTEQQSPTTPYTENAVHGTLSVLF